MVESLNERVSEIEIKVKVIGDNNIIIQELVKSTLDYLEGLGEFLQYRPRTHSEKELGYGKNKSIKGGEKQNE